jgi:hypothetical protein
LSDVDVTKRDKEITRHRAMWKGVPCYLQPEHPRSRTRAMRIGDPPGAVTTVWFDAEGNKLCAQVEARR